MSTEPKSTARRDKTDEWDFRKPVSTEPKLERKMIENRGKVCRRHGLYKTEACEKCGREGESAAAQPSPQGGTFQQCAWCGHAVHARGKKCGVPRPEKNNKPCKCKAGGGWLDGLGNAIGESLFGGDR